jgi:2-polyprenyl-3-methyl-5-hydroxy-6-metoxy-1,4-benzoquinol methylase
MQKTDQDVCLLCGQAGKEKIFGNNAWHVYKCTSCGFGLLNPLPSDEEITKLYDDEYCKDQFVDGGDVGTSEFNKRLRNEKHRVQLFKRIIKKGKVLDIGCGYGYFLAACRQNGYEVQGLDISSWAAEYTRKKLNIPVVVGTLCALEAKPHSFDVITMWHFLEHTRNPRQVLLEAKKMLKEDGLLVVEVPNYKGTDAQRSWNNWVGWQLPYHFCHFTPENLIELLSQVGFEVIKTKDYHSETVKMSLQTIPVVRYFARIIAKMYSGHSVAMVARLKNKC